MRDGVTNVDLFKINEPRIVALEASCQGVFSSMVSVDELLNPEASLHTRKWPVSELCKRQSAFF